MKDMIVMSNKKIHRVEAIQKLIDRRLVESEAARQLQLSIRQVRRLKKSYLADGATKGLVNKKRGQVSKRRRHNDRE